MSVPQMTHVIERTLVLRYGDGIRHLQRVWCAGRCAITVPAFLIPLRIIASQCDKVNISARAIREEQRIVRISLPLPPDILRPNRIGGANKYAVSRARREARAMACHCACYAWHGVPLTVRPGERTVFWQPMPVWKNVRATATFSGVSKLSDTDNIWNWLKNYRDGIADALCGGAGDHGWEYVGLEFEKGPKGLTITVWPVEGGE